MVHELFKSVPDETSSDKTTSTSNQFKIDIDIVQTRNNKNDHS
jgi:hypothetical protein